ncbi:hypothetical protein PENTCL1PPCAC_5485, partial [Pristionchus entomophagus]
SPFLHILLHLIIRTARNGDDEGVSDWWDVVRIKEIAQKTLLFVVRSVGSEHLSEEEWVEIEEILPTAKPVSIFGCSNADKSGFVVSDDFCAEEETTFDDDDMFGKGLNTNKQADIGPSVKKSGQSEMMGKNGED